MKKIFFLIAFLAIALITEAQDIFKQTNNIVIQQSDIETKVYQNAILQIKPHKDMYTRIGRIDLVLANSAGESQAVFSTLQFSDCGGPGYMTNWKEFDEFQKAELLHTEAIGSVISEIECLFKERTRSDEKRQTEIDSEIGKLREREVLLRSDERFTQENRVNQKWVYDLTFDRLSNELFDGDKPTKALMDLLQTHTVYDFLNEELMIRVGEAGSFFQLSK